MNMVQENKGNCCGCTACLSICPKNAIKMSQDGRGFFYPEIDETKCTHCGLCKNVCDFDHFMKENSNFARSYAVRHKNINEVMTSRSGGFFSALAEAVIKQGGLCYGAILDSNLEVIHKKAETYEECLRFKGSKYVQSKMDGSLFLNVKKDLESGRKVLFSGTGCQVHGLLRFLDSSKTDHSKLITVDFICHGVPSPGVWKNYIAEVEQRMGLKVTGVDFRNKRLFGWTAHIETYKFEDGSEDSNSNWADVYYQHCMFRDSCYICPYITPYRKSDFTIGDYWGFEKVVDGYRDNKGLSLVIAHSDKADKMLSELNDKLFIEKTDLEMYTQPQLRKPTYKGPEYKRFWKKYDKDSRKAVKEFFFPSTIRKLYLLAFKQSKKVAKSSIRMFRSIKQR